jgi:hypothetical protein
MKTVFKKGDKVRITSSNNNSQNCIGEIGIIREIEQVGRDQNNIQFRVQVFGRSNMANWHDTTEVELVEESKS